MTTMNPRDVSILLVESSDTQREIIVKELKKQGVIELAEAKTVTEALSMIEKSSYDLVISAMYYNDGTGLDLLKKIKTKDKIADTSFILRGDEYKRESLEKFKQCDVTAILPSSFTHEHLLSAINTTIGLLNVNELDFEYFDVHEIKVLLVHDSRLARSHVKRVLNSLGLMQIKEAINGQEAINLIADNMFDLVITNYNMPEVDESEFTHFVRKQSKQSHIPIIKVTNENNDTHFVNIEQDGVNTFCDKTFEPLVVKQVFYKLLGH